MIAAAKLFLSGLPKQLWWALGAAVALWLAAWVHTDWVHTAYNAAYKQGAEDATAAIEAEQAAIDRQAREKIAAQSAKADTISKETIHDLDKATQRIDDRATAILVRHDRQAESHAQAGRVPAAGESTGQPCPAAAADGLPWSVALPLMVQAEKNQAQLNALIDWTIKQDALAAEGEAIANP